MLWFQTCAPLLPRTPSILEVNGKLKTAKRHMKQHQWKLYLDSSVKGLKQLISQEKKKIKEEYAAHLKRHKDAMMAEARNKERANEEGKHMAASYDLQSVPQLPSSNVFLRYYSRKLCIFNLTVWEGKKEHQTVRFAIFGQRLVARAGASK
ncbi:organic cation transporter protein [Plakobranchus ocellatus]|uniref:Organic cation transporter protein n=1 Tax=Plakobranchus ocellatus TaxID=259542 RepID=A0AAV4AGV9_9GAST|nr:organic cation transporter protein [Plakobranchus ocellatus]